MIHYDPLDKLLTALTLELAKLAPEDAAGMAAYIQLEIDSQEVDETGKPTKKAHRAQTRLRNRFLVEETNEKSRHKAEKQELNLHREMAASIAEMILKWAKWRTYSRKIAMLNEHENHQSAVGRSREDHHPESKFSLAYPLIECLEEEGVSPSSMGRLPVFARRAIADLIKALGRDRLLTNPHNPWTVLARAGALEAYCSNLPEEEMKVLAYAASQRDEKASEWAAKARRELNLPEGFSRSFLEGAARIALATGELTHGESRAYNEAYSLQIDEDIRLLGKVIGRESEEDLLRLTTLAHFIKEVPCDLDSDRMHIRLMAVKQAIDAIEPHKKFKDDWVREVVNLLPGLAANLWESVDSVAAFNILLMHGLDLTKAKKGFAEREDQEKAERSRETLDVDIWLACKSGARFKIYRQALIFADDPEYEEIAAEEWTHDRWIEVYGCLPGDEPQADETVATPADESADTNVDAASETPPDDLSWLQIDDDEDGPEGEERGRGRGAGRG